MSIRLGVLGSGAGSNFRAIHEAIAAGKLDAKIMLVASDNRESGILAHARESGYPTYEIEPGGLKTRLEAGTEEALAAKLHAAGAEYVVLAGYMRVLKEPLLAAFPQRILNIHPSLLPDFRGLRAWEQALKAGAKITGCTVHWVDAEIDHGDLIAQCAVPVLEGDTAESLHARIQKAEHRLFPAVLRMLAAGHAS